MKQIYAWYTNMYNWELPNRKLKWEWSKKKKKYFAKIDTWENIFVFFKTWYLVVLERWNKKDIDCVKNFYHKIENWKVIKVENDWSIPF